jgi:hypothetical protein
LGSLESIFGDHVSTADISTEMVTAGCPDNAGKAYGLLLLLRIRLSFDDTLLTGRGPNSPCFHPALHATPPSSIQASSRLHSAKDLRANQSDPERIHETHRVTEQGIEAAFPRRRPPKDKTKTEVRKMLRPKCRDPVVE